MSAGSAKEETRSSSLIAFTYRDFRYWVSYRFLSGVAYQIKTVGIGWYLYDTTGSTIALGLAGLFAFLPSIVFALVTGHVADTYNRKLIVTLSFWLCTFAMGILTLAVFQGVAPLWLIYTATVLMGIGRAFANPASQAITPNLVPKEHFANAITWYSSCWHMATIAGPVIGGLLYAFAGTKVVFITATVVFAISAICAWVLRTPLDPPKSGRGPISMETLLAGFTFMWGKPVMFGAVALDCVAVLFGGVNALLPVIAKDVLQAGPEALGLLRSSPAVGAILMSAVVARYPVQSRAGQKMLISVAIYGALIALFGFSPWLWTSVILLGLIGAADMISVVIRHTMVQAETPDDMRGRVAAVNSIFIGATGDLGEFRAGLSAAAVGVVPAIVLGGITTVGFALLWFKLFPALAKRDKLIEH
jgi:MFS family permease